MWRFKTVAVWFRYTAWDGRGIANRFEVDQYATLDDLWPRIRERAGESIGEADHYTAKQSVE
jgi:hypothetical protein